MVQGFGNNINIKINADKKAVDDAFNSIDSSSQKVGKNLQKNLGAAMAAVGAATAAVGIAGVTAAIKFEDAFAGVVKTVDASDKQLKQLSDGFRQLAREIPLSVQEFARIGELGGQLGIAAEDILGFTKTIAEVAAATELTVEEASLGFAQIANVTGIATSELSNMASALVGLGNNSATNEAKILNMTQRIASAGVQAGLSTDALLSIAAAFSSAGVQAEAGGTAISKVFLTITAAVDTADERVAIFARTAGYESANAFAQAWESNPVEAFERFVLGLTENGNSAFQTLEALELADMRLVNAFGAASASGEKFSAILDQGTKDWEENTAAAEEARKRYETTASQLSILKNNVNDVGISIGAALLPTVKELVENLSPVLERISEWIQKNPEWVKAIGAIGVGIGAAGAALFTFATVTIPIGIAAIAGFGVALGVATGGLSLLVGALVAFAAAYATNLGGVRDKTNEFFGDIRDTYEEWVGWLIPEGKIGQAIKGTASIFGVEFDSIKDVVGAAVGFIIERIKNMFFIIDPSTVKGVIDAFRTIWENGWDGVVMVVEDAVNGVIGAVNGFIDKFNAVAGKIGADIIPRFEEVTFANRNLAKAFEDTSITIDTSYMASLDKVLAKSGEAQGATDDLTESEKFLQDAARVAAENGLPDVATAMQNLVSPASNAGEAITGIKDGIITVTDVSKSFSEYLRNNFPSALESIRNETGETEISFQQLIDKLVETNRHFHEDGDDMVVGWTQHMRDLRDANTETESAFQTFGSNLAAFVGDAIGRVDEGVLSFRQSLDNLVNNIKQGELENAFRSAVRNLIDMGIEPLGNSMQDIIDQWERVKENLKWSNYDTQNFIGPIEDMNAEIAGVGRNIGNSLVTGMEQSIQAGSGQVAQSVRQGVNDALDEVDEELNRRINNLNEQLERLGIDPISGTGSSQGSDRAGQQGSNESLASQAIGLYTAGGGRVEAVTTSGQLKVRMQDGSIRYMDPSQTTLYREDPTYGGNQEPVEGFEGSGSGQATAGDFAEGEASPYLGKYTSRGRKVIGTNNPNDPSKATLLIVRLPPGQTMPSGATTTYASIDSQLFENNPVGNNFARKGIVPGAPSEGRLAILHGGEVVSSPGTPNEGVGGSGMNFNFNFSGATFYGFNDFKMQVNQAVREAISLGGFSGVIPGLA